MKIALCTTTINVPTVLELYRKLGPDVAFFIAGDLKSPHEEISALCRKIGNAHYFHPEHQVKWKCSELIGWNTISRRNIAFLEALKWGAEIIVTIDDDNLPMSSDYFVRFDILFSSRYNGLGVKDYWFDPGQWQFPNDGIDPVCQRGFPQGRISAPRIESVVGQTVGVAQGLCLGDPDTSAVDRISRHPQVHVVSELLRAGIVVDPGKTRTIWNSQNTAIVRGLVPAMFLFPQFKRYDDIMASLVTQRIMLETGHVTHFGQPMVFQERNNHDLTVDLANELWGMQRLQTFQEHLASVFTTGTSVLDDLHGLFVSLNGLMWIPPGVSALGEAWLDDCEQVMG